MSIKKSKHFLFFLLLKLVVQVAVEGKVTSLIQVPDLNLALDTINLKLYDVSLGSCALNCHMSEIKCCSFYYNKQTRLCTLGYWIIPLTTTRNEMNNLYSLGQCCEQTYQLDISSSNTMSCDSNIGITLSVQTQANQKIVSTFCNTTDNFFIMTNGSTTVCAWISDQVTNYATARATCTAKGANLYTFKTTEKAYLLIAMSQSTQGQHMWIGLNDIQQEGVYRWVDDNSTIPISSLLIPYTDVYDLSGDEDCFFMFPPYTGVDDLGCANGKSFICEMNPQC